MKETLIQLGIHIDDLMAGFAGGVVNAFVFKRSDSLSIIGSVVVGALTANYLGETASKYLNLSSGTAAFIVGLCAMAICQGIIEGAKNWRPGGSNGQSNKS